MRKKFSYTLRESKRAKRVRLAVYCNGSVVVTSPFGVRQSIIDKFVSDKMQWIMEKVRFLNNIKGKEIRTLSHDDYLKYKDEVFVLVEKRVEFYNKIYGYSFNKIYIKNQKTRWGSCSKKGNLNLNYKILFLPEDLRDYIIVHEICHLKELNHSQKFWNLVVKVFPEYSRIKKELNRNGLSLS